MILNVLSRVYMYVHICYKKRDLNYNICPEDVTKDVLYIMKYALKMKIKTCF